MYSIKKIKVNKLLFYSNREIDDFEFQKSFSVFLAGPTPRKQSVPSWRPDMIKELCNSGFKGNILLPEYKNEKSKRLEYDKQIKWEVDNLNRANVILFWIPRDMSTLPGLTTNIEFGEFMKTGKVVLGYPENAEYVRYIGVRAQWLDIPTANTMSEVAALVTNKEKLWLYACPKCLGSGFKDSNGMSYRCGTCEGTGFLMPKKHKNKTQKSGN